MLDVACAWETHISSRLDLSTLHSQSSRHKHHMLHELKGTNFGELHHQGRARAQHRLLDKSKNSNIHDSDVDGVQLDLSKVMPFSSCDV